MDHEPRRSPGQHLPVLPPLIPQSLMDQLLSRHPHPLPQRPRHQHRHHPPLTPLPYRRRHQHRHHAPLTPIPQPLPPQLLHRRPPVPHRRHAGIERHPLRHRDPPPPLPAHIPHLVRRLLPMVILPPHDHAAPHGGQQHHRPRCVIPPVHSRPPPDLSSRPALRLLPPHMHFPRKLRER